MSFDFLSTTIFQTLPSPIDSITNMSGSNNDSSSPTATHPLHRNPHLALFQTMGQILPRNPATVITRMTAWLCDGSSPRLWAPFALSLRGFAYEVMDEWDLARRDYTCGLNLYGLLLKELGSDTVKRMESNSNFMRVRIRTLPPPKPIPLPGYVIIEDDFPCLL
ncbi:hypothetical protein BU17DRAFT_94360 [Hysterangium stoloniferum]|nr:hypothetical protein BU17DRAFT_94360 [Hysterangium stoloniferum]